MERHCQLRNLRRIEADAASLGGDGLRTGEQVCVARDEDGQLAARAARARVRDAWPRPAVRVDPRDARRDRDEAVGAPQHHAADLVPTDDGAGKRHARVRQDVLVSHAATVGQAQDPVGTLMDVGLRQVAQRYHHVTQLVEGDGQVALPLGVAGV